MRFWIIRFGDLQQSQNELIVQESFSVIECVFIGLYFAFIFFRNFYIVAGLCLAFLRCEKADHSVLFDSLEICRAFIIVERPFYRLQQ